jgi:hypothetical protein
MLKLFLSITFITIINFSFGQKCKPFAQDEDEFTMEKMAYFGNFFKENYTSVLIDKPGVISYLLAKKDTKGNLQIALQSRYPGAIKVDHPDWFKTGVKFLIKLEDEVLTFETTKTESLLEKQSGMDGIYNSRKDVTRFTIVYLEAQITKEQLLKIANQKIDKIRFYVLTDSTDLSEDLYPGRDRMSKLQNQFRCLAESVN